MTTDIPSLAAAAKRASRAVATLATDQKNELLNRLADAIERDRAQVLKANATDMKAAQENGLPKAKLQRLALTDASIDQLAEGLRQIAALPDPIGQATKSYDAPSGLHVRKVRAPLGVIMMIYEARPGVTIDAFGLCFKAGNAAILKGGREALTSNTVLAGIAHCELAGMGVPPEALTLLTTSDRDEIQELLRQDASIDLVIPRGGESLIRFVHEHSTIPTVQHFHGVCHIYVDRAADLDNAIDLCAIAKTSAPATCNSAECVLVHADIAPSFVPRFAARCAADGVELRACDRARAIAPDLRAADESDFGAEFLDLIMSLRVVDDLDGAVDHIARFGSDHTDAILTGDDEAARAFTGRVHSSCVLVNASTRFNDGFQLGLGAEIGISTSRIHAYGPMGLEELTTQRYVVTGTGQTR